MNLLKRFRTWRSKRHERQFAWDTWQAMHPGLSTVAESHEFRILDGVDYRMPFMVPSEIARRGPAATENYLLETSQTYQGQFDQGRTMMYDGPVQMPTDDPLCEWNWSTRKMVLTNCHAAYQRNPLAKRAVDLTQEFAIGKGFNLTFQNTQVEEIITAFIANDENNVKEYEKTFLKDLQVDGELFIRFFERDGEVVIVPIPPWWVTKIDTDPQFFRRVEQYHVQPSASAYATLDMAPQDEYKVDAEQMLHVAINRHSYELRGRPDLSVVLPWLRAYKEWMEDRIRQNKWRGALLWWVKIAGAAVGTIAAKVLQYRKPPTPGSTVVTSDKETWTALSNPVGAADVSEDGRQTKLMIAVGAGLAEYMLSDGQNANLATATAQQLPALWKFTDAQEIMKEMVWTKIFQRVIEAAVTARRLSAQVELQDSDGDPVPDAEGAKQQIEAVEAFTVEYHELQSDDPKSVAEALTMDLTNGLVSVQTAQTKRGYDPVQEKKLMDREEAENRDKAGQGTQITPADIGLSPDGQLQQPPSGNGQQPPELARANGNAVPAG